MPAITDAPRAALLPLKLTIRGAGLALSVARGVGRRLLPSDSSERPERPSSPHIRGTEGRRRAAAPRNAEPAPPAPERVDPAPARPTSAPGPPAAAASEASVAAHVDREAVLVGEFADPGAAEGAGAEVRVAEPWDNYARLNADEIIDRLAAADAESLAAVRLYEATHRNRRTVIAAADRRLAQAGR